MFQKELLIFGSAILRGGLGKGDVLAQKSREYPQPQGYGPESANGDLEGYRNHPAPQPGSEKCYCFQQHA
eukprot:1143543-Pelagomonas_calceolata.AAC.1